MNDKQEQQRRGFDKIYYLPMIARRHPRIIRSDKRTCVCGVRRSVRGWVAGSPQNVPNDLRSTPTFPSELP